MAPTAAMLMLGHHHTGGRSTSHPPPPPPLPPADSPAAFDAKAFAVKWVLNYIPIFQQTPQPKQFMSGPHSSASDSAWENRFQEVLDLIYW